MAQRDQIKARARTAAVRFSPHSKLACASELCVQTPSGHDITQMTALNLSLNQSVHTVLRTSTNSFRLGASRSSQPEHSSRSSWIYSSCASDCKAHSRMLGASTVLKHTKDTTHMCAYIYMYIICVVYYIFICIYICIIIQKPEGSAVQGYIVYTLKQIPA